MLFEVHVLVQVEDSWYNKKGNLKLMESIIQDKDEYFICRVNYDVETTTGLHKHHIFECISRRRLSEKDGLKVYLCYRHHNFDNHSDRTIPILLLCSDSLIIVLL